MIFASYYGRLEGTPPVRDFSKDLMNERKRNMQKELKEMEDRIKRHITECKREVIKELISLINRNTEEEIKE